MDVKCYRKKPMKVEAMQWTGNNWCEIAQFAYGRCKLYNKCLFLTIENSQTTVETDDWILKDENDGLHVCSPDIFERLYEPID